MFCDRCGDPMIDGPDVMVSEAGRELAFCSFACYSRHRREQAAIERVRGRPPVVAIGLMAPITQDMADLATTWPEAMAWVRDGD